MVKVFTSIDGIRTNDRIGAVLPPRSAPVDR
jgi:hypothetical protein